MATSSIATSCPDPALLQLAQSRSPLVRPRAQRHHRFELRAGCSMPRSSPVVSWRRRWSTVHAVSTDGGAGAVGRERSAEGLAGADRSLPELAANGAARERRCVVVDVVGARVEQMAAPVVPAFGVATPLCLTRNWPSGAEFERRYVGGDVRGISARKTEPGIASREAHAVRRRPVTCRDERGWLITELQRLRSDSEALGRELAERDTAREQHRSALATQEDERSRLHEQAGAASEALRAAECRLLETMRRWRR